MSWVVYHVHYFCLFFLGVSQYFTCVRGSWLGGRRRGPPRVCGAVRLRALGSSSGRDGWARVGWEEARPEVKTSTRDSGSNHSRSNRLLAQGWMLGWSSLAEQSRGEERRGGVGGGEERWGEGRRGGWSGSFSSGGSWFGGEGCLRRASVSFKKAAGCSPVGARSDDFSTFDAGRNISGSPPFSWVWSRVVFQCVWVD